MYRFASALVLALLCSTAAEATCTPPSNGTTADATALNTYLNCQFAPLASPSITGTITASSDIYANGTYYYGDNKAMFQYSDSWLRLNPSNAFTSGIYAGTGILRTDGNLEVGSAGAYFNVTAAGAVSMAGNLTMGNATASTGYMIHAATASGSDNDFLSVGGGGAANDTSRGGYITLIGNEFSTYGLYGDTIVSSGQATSGVGGSIIFDTDPTNGSTNNTVARMTITNAGNVGIGTATPATLLTVVGDIRVGTSGTNGCLENFAGTALTGTCSSDARLKTVVGNVSNVLGKLSDLQLVKFHWNDTAASAYHNSTAVLNTGFLAQDVEKQFPELVSLDKLGYRQVDYTALSLYSLEAIKELKAANDAQAVQQGAIKDEVRALQAQNARLEAVVEKQAAELGGLESELKMRASSDGASKKLTRLGALNTRSQLP